jgi:hypothetical protein
MGVNLQHREHRPDPVLEYLKAWTHEHIARRMFAPKWK